jgi:hypothetical protein
MSSFSHAGISDIAGQASSARLRCVEWLRYIFARLNMQTLPNDHRRFPERRSLDEGLPPGMSERRIHAERRGFQVVELNFDEQIVLGAPSGVSPG